MSTRPEPTHADATTTSPRTDHATDFSTNDDATSGALTPRGDVPWTERCTRQFDPDDADRMRNLADDANRAMHDGV